MLSISVEVKDVGKVEVKIGVTDGRGFLFMTFGSRGA